MSKDIYINLGPLDLVVSKGHLAAGVTAMLVAALVIASFFRRKYNRASGND